MFEPLYKFIRETYHTDSFISLHEPVLGEVEKRYLCEVIDSGFVSSVGKYVDLFEQQVASKVDSPFAVAVVNGTAALHLALLAVGVESGDEVLTQSLTFVATANAISYCGATPVFLDVNSSTLGLSSKQLQDWLQKNTKKAAAGLINRNTGKRIAACLPMHTFGNSCEIEDIAQTCREFGIPLVEDAAEALGSYYRGKHLGTFGDVGTLSFNGNKVITTGGGGVVLTANKQLAQRIKHISTTAKKAHAFAFNHDEIGFNYRMPNVNAALGCAQLERLEDILTSKRKLFLSYQQFLRSNYSSEQLELVEPIPDCTPNHWLNTVKVKNKHDFQDLLTGSQKVSIMIRPAWTPMHQLPMYELCQQADLSVTTALTEQLVSLPSTAVGHK